VIGGAQSPWPSDRVLRLRAAQARALTHHHKLAYDAGLMTYPFLLSYARSDATTGEDPPQADANFESFLRRLNQRVRQLTGSPGFVDRNNILAGQEWPEELAEALRTAQTMVCLYSPSYFLSEYCGKEMQVFLDRRRKASAGKKPANIIPVLWQPVPRRIPKTLPDIQFKSANLNEETQGVWNLGDQNRQRELIDIADQIALRVRDAADLTPLAPLPARPHMNAVRSAFLPPPLPRPEFDDPDTSDGPNTVTFVYPSPTRWSEWPWAPPEDRAVLYLAAAVAKGSDMESTQLTFDLNDANLTGRLAALRRRNNVVILLVDAASLAHDNLRARIQDFDRPEHSPFAAIVMDNNAGQGLRATLDRVFPYFSRRAAPHFHIVQSGENFIETRESFSDIVSDALAQLRLAVANHPYAPNPIDNPTGFQNLPGVNGPGRRE
jgi:hypothetical protein